MVVSEVARRPSILLGDVDEELKQLDLATAGARRLATAALDGLRAPQTALREAAAEYVVSVAQRRLDASRHASVEAMAKLSDDEIVELRLWTSEQITHAREEVEREIAACDFWIPETPGLSPSDVSAFSNALMPMPKDTRTGIPQVMVHLFEQCLAPMRRGLAAVGLAIIPADAEPGVEVALARAWRVYREAAVDCVSRWADVDEHYHASTERFQEMRWELAGQADVEMLKTKREAQAAEDTETPQEPESVAAQAARAAASPPGAVARQDSETLVAAS